MKADVPMLESIVNNSKERNPERWKGELRICSVCLTAKDVPSFSVIKRRGKPYLDGRCKACVRKLVRDRNKIKTGRPSLIDDLSNLKGIDRVIAISKLRYPDKWKDDKRVCNKCNVAKELDQFKTYQSSNKKQIASCCKQCKRISDREYIQSLDAYRLEKRREACRRYRTTDKYKKFLASRKNN